MSQKRPNRKSQLITRTLRGMNTDLHLTVRIDDDGPDARAQAEAALDACAAWLTAMERALSRFLPASELRALNVSAGAPFAASDDLFAVVALALDAATSTAGLFDPTILPALHAAGYTRTFDDIAHREINDDSSPRPAEAGFAAGGPSGAVSTADPSAGWRAIQLDPARRTITLPPGCALDLGGIAKGWAADELARRFLAPFPAYLVDLGGDLRLAGGPAPGEPWIVGIADPRAASAPPDEARPRHLAHLAGLALSRGGVATSGDARRWWRRGGERQHHLIDPRTGRPAHSDGPASPARRALSLTALAPTAAEADVLAKVAFLRGHPDGLRSLTRGARSAGVCVFADGHVEATPNLEDYLHAANR